MSFQRLPIEGRFLWERQDLIEWSPQKSLDKNHGMFTVIEWDWFFWVLLCFTCDNETWQWTPICKGYSQLKASGGFSSDRHDKNMTWGWNDWWISDFTFKIGFYMILFYHRILSRRKWAVKFRPKTKPSIRLNSISSRYLWSKPKIVSPPKPLNPKRTI